MALSHGLPAATTLIAAVWDMRVNVSLNLHVQVFVPSFGKALATLVLLPIL